MAALGYLHVLHVKARNQRHSESKMATLLFTTFLRVRNVDSKMAFYV